MKWTPWARHLSVGSRRTAQDALDPHASRELDARCAMRDIPIATYTWLHAQATTNTQRAQ